MIERDGEMYSDDGVMHLPRIRDEHGRVIAHGNVPTAERRWAESLFESSPEEDAKLLWEPDDRPLYARSVEEIAAYERSRWGVLLAMPTRTATLTRESIVRVMVGMRYPLRGPALDRPPGTYR